MVLECPKGWEQSSAPSTPTDLSYIGRPEKGFLTGVRYTMFRSGKYEWVPADGVLPVQGNCGKQSTFSSYFYIEKNSAHTVNIGVAFGGETEGGLSAQVSGGYAYTWGSTAGAGSQVSETVGPDANEYLMTPVVLQFRYCWGWLRDSVPWYAWAASIVGSGSTSGTPRGLLGLDLFDVGCDPPLYLRGGLLICRRACDPATSVPSAGAPKGRTSSR